MSTDNNTNNNAKTMNALGLAIEAATTRAKKDRLKFFKSLSDAVAYFVGEIINKDNAELCETFLSQFMENTKAHLEKQNKEGEACFDAVMDAIGGLGLGKACVDDAMEELKNLQPHPSDLDELLKGAAGAAVVDAKGNIVRTMSGDELRDFMKELMDGEDKN